MILNTEIVTFRDGTKVVVSEATWSISMKLQELEAQATKDLEGITLENVSDGIFQTLVYPKLLACSSGDVPTLAQALEMPSTELDKWYFAVKRVNPDWFETVEAEVESAEKNLSEKTSPIVS